MPATSLPEATSVVIVGAGPAGLTAAIVLAEAGVDHVLIDRLGEGANTSRAAVVHARTLEVLDGLGIASALVERGIEVPTFKLHDGAKTLATIEFGDLPTEFPYTLMVPQDVTEQVLLDRLHELGGAVYRPLTVTKVTEENGSVTVEYVDEDDQRGEIEADYVIGADGMHSVVREQVGIGFTGDTYPASFILADVRMSWPAPRSEVSLHLSPKASPWSRHSPTRRRTATASSPPSTRHRNTPPSTTSSHYSTPGAPQARSVWTRSCGAPASASTTA